MLPKVIVYNSVSVDGAIKDFDVDIPLHYEVLGRLGADALLVGSNTAKTGIDLFMETVPAEEPSDFSKPAMAADDNRLLWVIPDSRGVLQGLLHVHRRSEYVKDIVVLLSKKTPQSYRDYLVKRNYDFIITGDEHIDYRLALQELNRHYGVQTVVTDSGGVLVSVLLENGLVYELRLLISPEIVGKKTINLFRNLNRSVKLQLINAEIIRDNHMLLTYRVQK